MDVAERVREHKWYHALELAPGVVTPGLYDLRGEVAKYHLPERLDGKRALDVGTWDGFWAFELERRGAEVVALDLDDEAAAGHAGPPSPELLAPSSGRRLPAGA